MNKNEIKKAIYREKPRAFATIIVDGHLYFMCHLEDKSSPTFKIPIEELKGATWDCQEMDAKLLLRWLE